MTSHDVQREPTAANSCAGGNLGGKLGLSRGCLSIQLFTCEFDSDLGHHADHFTAHADLLLTQLTGERVSFRALLRAANTGDGRLLLKFLRV
jgi:hypothetical protein